MTIDKLIKFRTDLHQIPELGHEEFKTQEYILNELEGLDCKIDKVGTGVVAYFDTGGEKTIAFRCDMDALPITEETNLSFKSLHVGKMHACGHDGHMSMVIGLAHYISENKKDINKNIVLIFQPSEERDAGANVIIDSGLLQGYNTSAIFGMHLWPMLEKGRVFSRAGEFMAGASEIDITVHGEATHIANTGEGINAMQIGAKLILAINELDESIPDDKYSFIRFGKMQSGVAGNILSAKTEFFGSLRTFDADMKLEIKDKLESIVTSLEKEYNTKINIEYRDGYDPVINNKALLDGLIDKGMPVIVLDKPSMTAEDFGLYAKIAPINFFFLGLGETPALHNEKFDFDMEVLESGFEFFKRIIEKY